MVEDLTYRQVGRSQSVLTRLKLLDSPKKVFLTTSRTGRESDGQRKLNRSEKGMFITEPIAAVINAETSKET